MIQNLKNFFKENRLVSFLFIVSTLFFLTQHYFDFNWDFAAYIINAKYLFYGGNYYEVYRAPLISIILAPLLLLGKLAPYLYVLFVSSLFLYSTKKLAYALHENYFKKFNITKKTTFLLFYFFSLNFFTLAFGILIGTELLALSFFQLFLAYFIMNKNSGHWLALAFLSRYNFFIFTPFLLFNKSIKQIAKNLGLFLLITAPWFIFNKISWGNFFTSISDAFYLNMFSRLDRVQAFEPSSLLSVTNWFLPILIIGLIVPLIIIIRSKNYKISTYKYEILFAVIFMFFFYDIYTIPFKINRYMFNMTLPIAFFCTLGAIFIIKNLKKYNYKKFFFTILIIGFSVSIIILGINFFRISESDYMYLDAANGIRELGLEDCRVVSPHWVPVNYYTGNVRHMQYSIEEELERGEIMLIFHQSPTIDDKFTYEDIEKAPKLKQTKIYTIIANQNLTPENCIKTSGYSSPIIPEPCSMLSNKFHNNFMKNTFLKVCRDINYLFF